MGYFECRTAIRRCGVSINGFQRYDGSIDRRWIWIHPRYLDATLTATDARALADDLLAAADEMDALARVSASRSTIESG